jgi:hypothetical protein
MFKVRNEPYVKTNYGQTLWWVNIINYPYYRVCYKIFKFHHINYYHLYQNSLLSLETISGSTVLLKFFKNFNAGIWYGNTKMPMSTYLSLRQHLSW